MVERAQDVHDYGSEALSDARAKSFWPRANTHFLLRRVRSEVTAW